MKESSVLAAYLFARSAALRAAAPTLLAALAHTIAAAGALLFM